MFKPNTKNINILIKALNNDVIAFQQLLHISEMPPKVLKNMLSETNNRINETAKEQNISREESMNNYINDLKKL